MGCVEVVLGRQKKTNNFQKDDPLFLRLPFLEWFWETDRTPLPFHGFRFLLKKPPAQTCLPLFRRKVSQDLSRDLWFASCSYACRFLRDRLGKIPARHDGPFV